MGKDKQKHRKTKESPVTKSWDNRFFFLFKAYILQFCLGPEEEECTASGSCYNIVKDQ